MDQQGRKANEYVNTVFTMEQHQQQAAQGLEATNEKNLRQLGGVGGGLQQNLEMNKTSPMELTVGVEPRKNEEETTSCACIARKLGMDAQRLSKFYSLFLALLATVALTFSIFLIKLSHSLNASQMATVKFGTQLMLCFPFAYFYRQSLLGPSGSRRWLIARGLTGSLSILAAYFSIKMIHFGDSMAIRYSSPIITALFAHFLLKQKLKWVHPLSLILSVLGVLFIVRPSAIFGTYGQTKATETSVKFILGVSLAALSAISAGSTFVFIKKLTQKSIHFVVIIFYYTLLGLVLSLVVSFILYFCTPPTVPGGLKVAKSLVLNDISLSFLAGAISFVGHVSFTLAIARENANNIAFLRTTDILLAFALDYFVTDLIPNPFTIIGAILIFISVVVILAFRIDLHRRDRASDYENNEAVFRI